MLGNQSSRRERSHRRKLTARLSYIAEQAFGGTDCRIETCRPRACFVTEFEPSNTTLFHSTHLFASYLRAINTDSDLVWRISYLPTRSYRICSKICVQSASSAKVCFLGDLRTTGGYCKYRRSCLPDGKPVVPKRQMHGLRDIVVVFYSVAIERCSGPVRV